MENCTNLACMTAFRPLWRQKVNDFRNCTFLWEEKFYQQQTFSESCRRHFVAWKQDVKSWSILLVNNIDQQHEMHAKVFMAENCSWKLSTRLGKIYSNVQTCPDRPDFAATVRTCALRVARNGACNCCDAFLPLWILHVHSRRLAPAPTSCAEHYVIGATQGEDPRRRKRCIDGTFDVFSSMESRRDKDGKGNQSLQWWKQGGKKANAWGVINKGRWQGGGGGGGGAFRAICAQGLTGRSCAAAIDEIWFTSGWGNIQHRKIKQGARAHLKQKIKGKKSEWSSIRGQTPLS